MIYRENEESEEEFKERLLQEIDYLNELLKQSCSEDIYFFIRDLVESELELETYCNC